MLNHCAELSKAPLDSFLSSYVISRDGKNAHQR